MQHKALRSWKWPQIDILFPTLDYRNFCRLMGKESVTENVQDDYQLEGSKDSIRFRKRSYEQSTSRENQLRKYRWMVTKPCFFEHCFLPCIGEKTVFTIFGTSIITPLKVRHTRAAGGDPGGQSSLYQDQISTNSARALRDRVIRRQVWLQKQIPGKG
jgi:hypothetical protein